MLFESVSCLLGCFCGVMIVQMLFYVYDSPTYDITTPSDSIKPEPLTPEQLERDAQENWMARFRVECGDPDKYTTPPTPEEYLRNEKYQPGGM